MRKAIEYAMRLGLTIYDSSYIALAQSLNTPLYTADKKLIDKAKGLGIVKHVMEFKV